MSVCIGSLNVPIVDCCTRLYCLQEEREARELVKKEQDEAYQASLRQDRAKVGRQVESSQNSLHYQPFERKLTEL